MARKIVCKIFAVALSVTLVGCSINNLPKGELQETIYSENKEYAINIYLCAGNATTDNSIRGEIENTRTKDKKNLYWEYHCDEAEVEWIDDITVIINGHKLNVLEDTYDWRDE